MTQFLPNQGDSICSKMEVPTIWPIEQFEKDFEILGKISEGAFGEVFKAKSKPSRMSKLFSSSALRQFFICYYFFIRPPPELLLVLGPLVR